MARLGEVAFVHPQQQAAPSLSNSTTGRGPTPMPPWRDARDQMFVNPERVEHRPPHRERENTNLEKVGKSQYFGKIGFEVIPYILGNSHDYGNC